MNKFSKIILLLILISAGFTFLYSKEGGIRSFFNANAQAQTEPDAIAIRIMPNPEHYDPLRWYKEQGFQGDPERITVNGYNGVMDDRTAYVNVANIVNDEFYTNIYIISFTQNPTPNTIEIFQRMLDNWTFNTNLVDQESDLGTCSLSNINCVSDDDCSTDYKCSDNQKCVPEKRINCYNDSECPANIFCDSEKAITARDTERLAQMKEIEMLAEEYKKKYGNYPKLEAGTYLPGKTISVWPSWENTFQKELAGIISEYSVFDSLPKDPINRLSRCSASDTPDFNQTTCWNEYDKEFSGNVTANAIVLPTYEGEHPYTGELKTYKSHAYTYVHGSFNACAPLERSGVNVKGFDIGGCSADSNVSSHRESANNPPRIYCGNLSAHPGRELSRFIQVSDPEGDSIVDWSISTEGTSWTGWSSPPNIEQSPIEGYARVYADEVGNEGEYGFQVSATDSAGNSATQACSIESGNNPPVVSVSCPSSVRVDHNYDCYLNAYDPDGDEVTYDSVSGLPPGITHSSGHITGAPTSSGDYTIEVNTSDPFGESASASYNLSVDTYCGDGAVQDPNDEGVSEECDTYGGNGASASDQYECLDNCRWTGGYCGDGICGSQDDTYSADNHEVCGVCAPDCGSDHDDDEDGIGACNDNCPNITNPSQSDIDNDGVGDLCDDCYDYNGQCINLTISQGEWSRSFTPYTTNESMSDFYCYSGNCPACNDNDPDTLCTEYGASSNIVEYNIVKDKRSVIFAHLHPSTNMLSLGFIHDKPQDGSGGSVDFSFSGEGWNMATVAVADDGSHEFSKSTHGNWGWVSCCTDGGAIDIAPLDTYWSITIEPEFNSGIDSWMAKSPGGLDFGEFVPDITKPITISYSP